MGVAYRCATKKTQEDISIMKAGDKHNKLINLFIFMFGVAVIACVFGFRVEAAEYEWGVDETYDNTSTYQQLSDQHEDSQWEYGYYIKDKKTDSGASLTGTASLDYNFDPYAAFVFGTYANDEILNINQRVDIGLGMSYTLIDDGYTKLKPSYALLLREDRVLGSLRIKYRYFYKYLVINIAYNKVETETNYMIQTEFILPDFDFIRVGIKKEGDIKDNVLNPHTTSYIKWVI